MAFSLNGMGGAALCMAETYFHIGILVPDLKKAVREYREILGLEFHEPTTMPLASMEQPGLVETQSLNIAFSKAGPPYYELIEATGTGLFSATHGEGMHHIGVWMRDPQEILRTLEKRKIKVVAINRLPDGTPLTIFTHPTALSGIRIEYVNANFRPMVEHFLATGRFADA
jgi:catechol 2,3-dioxygenase-like lactoylglutathione lyase family enzyme